MNILLWNSSDDDDIDEGAELPILAVVTHVYWFLFLLFFCFIDSDDNLETDKNFKTFPLWNSCPLRVNYNEMGLPPFLHIRSTLS